ncbi:hypothetical protein C8A05DRAFT_39953, partial [Staphylotrichum tortipilum]
MNNYFPPPLSPSSTCPRLAMHHPPQQDHPDGMGLLDTTTPLSHHTTPLSTMDSTLPPTPHDPSPPSLDDIAIQNTRAFLRRRSVPHPFADSLPPHHPGLSARR